MPLRMLPFLFLIVPVLEITVFIMVGSRIGVLPTILLVLATAVAGATLLRVQGFGVLARIRMQMEAGGLPGRELGNGAMILAAGLLLLTPGFITDTIGLLLFVPAVRDRIWQLLVSRVSVVANGFPGGLSGGPGGGPRGDRGNGRPRDGVVDLEPGEFTGTTAGKHKDSPWIDRAR
jgi:UPF0716 protein FxsA